MGQSCDINLQKEGAWKADMRLRSLIPVLDVRDVEASIVFYCDILGFTVQDKVEWAGKTEWALLRSEQVQLMLCAGQEGDIEDHPRYSEGVFFLYHENPESLLVYLDSRGVDGEPDLLQPTQRGRDFYLRDPDGYVLWFSHKPVVKGVIEAAVVAPIAVPVAAPTVENGHSL